MARAVELAAVVGAATVDQALGLAAITSRFADDDLPAILDHLAARAAAGDAVLADEAHSANTYSSISPARMAAAASVAPPMSMGPPSSALSRVISVTASPVTRRVFQSTVLVVEENTTFGMSRQRRANSISAGVAPGCWSAVGQWELIVSHSLRPYNARPVAPTRSDHHWNSSSLGTLQPMSSPGAAM